MDTSHWPLYTWPNLHSHFGDCHPCVVPFRLEHPHDFEHTQGFTSATGRSWEKHDMLSWYFCELVREGKLTADAAHTHAHTSARPCACLPQHGCPRNNISERFEETFMDYHQNTKLWEEGEEATPEFSPPSSFTPPPDPPVV